MNSSTPAAGVVRNAELVVEQHPIDGFVR